MPKVYKASNVILDKDNKVSIEILDTYAVSTEVPEIPDIPHTPDETDEKLTQKARDDIISKAKAEAESIKKKADENAKAIKEDAIRGAEKAIAELEEKSRTKGYSEGYAKGTKEADKLKAEAQNIRAQAEAYREETIRTIEPDMLDLIVSVLGKLLLKAADIKSDVIMNLIRQGVSGATLTGDIMIHVSRYDYDDVSHRRDEIFSFGDFTNANIEFVKDMSLNKADCIIETAFGNIDCSLDRQFAALREDLYYILDNR